MAEWSEDRRCYVVTNGVGAFDGDRVKAGHTYQAVRRWDQQLVCLETTEGWDPAEVNPADPSFLQAGRRYWNVELSHVRLATPAESAAYQLDQESRL